MAPLHAFAPCLAGWSLCLAGVLAAGPAAAETFACKNGKITGDLLFGYAEGYAGGRGYRFGQGVEFEFPPLLEKAASLVRARPSQECEPALARTKRSIRRVVDHMIFVADEIPGYADKSPGVIGEQTFFETMKKLCPLWPIC